MFDTYEVKRVAKNVAKKSREVIKKFLSNTTFQCYHYLHDEGLHWSERIFWFVSIGLVSGFGIALMSRAVMSFTMNPVSLALDNLYLEWTNDYPAIVVCGKSTENVKDYQLEQETIIQMDPVTINQLTEMAYEIMYYNGLYSRLKDCKLVEGKELPDYCAILNQNFQNVIRFRLPCNRIFAACSWDGKPFDCCAELDEMNTTLGKCHSFNSMAANDKPKLYKGDSYEMRTLTIDFKIPKVVLYALSQEATLSTLIPEIGVKLLTVNDIYITFKNTFNEPAVRNIPIAVRGCRFPDENPLDMSRIYSYPACVVEEVARQQLKKCRCTQFFLPPLADTSTFCNKADDNYECVLENGKNFYQKAKNSGCLPGCTETDVRIVGIISANSSSAIRNMCPECVEKNLTRVNIHFYPPRLRYFRRVIRDTVDMIVNVGGIGTLFFGASAISVIELVYYFFIRPHKPVNQALEYWQQRMKTPKTKQRDALAYYAFKKKVLIGEQPTRPLPYRP